MKEQTKLEILKIMLRHIGSTYIEIHGTSMEPVLHDGEKCKLVAKDNYSVGDIMVYLYNDERLIAHRLLEKKDCHYICRGDNSFRVETICEDQILGVILTDDFNNTPEFIEASREISKLYTKLGYVHEEIKKQSEYLEYRRKFIER